MQFTALGYISTKNGKNTVEVEGVKYWISGQDVLRVAQSKGISTEGLRASEYGIDGEQVKVAVCRDENGTWAELLEQDTFCPNVV